MRRQRSVPAYGRCPHPGLSAPRCSPPSRTVGRGLRPAPGPERRATGSPPYSPRRLNGPTRVLGRRAAPATGSLTLVPALLGTGLVLALACALALAQDEALPKFPATFPTARQKLMAEEKSLQALEHMANSEWREAESSLLEALELVPTVAAPRVLLGAAREQLDDPEGAVQAYREALQWDPDNEAALSGLDRLGEVPYATEVSEYEAYLIDLINEERKQRGLDRLKPHPVLAEVARSHSEDMRDHGFFAHESPLPGKRTPLDRFLRRFDPAPALLAENVSRRYHSSEYSLNGPAIEATHQSLMSSEGHRENMLQPSAVYVAVGIAVNEQGDYWVTELSMRPLDPSLAP